MYRSYDYTFSLLNVWLVMAVNIWQSMALDLILARQYDWKVLKKEEKAMWDNMSMESGHNNSV